MTLADELRFGERYTQLEALFLEKTRRFEEEKALELEQLYEDRFQERCDEFTQFHTQQRAREQAQQQSHQQAEAPQLQLAS